MTQFSTHLSFPAERIPANCRGLSKAQIMQNLQRVGKQVVDPIKNNFGSRVTITSIFRTNSNNHGRGIAVDFQASPFTQQTTNELIEFAKKNCDFDIMIIEMPGCLVSRNSRTVIHIQVASGGGRNRKIVQLCRSGSRPVAIGSGGATSIPYETRNANVNNIPGGRGPYNPDKVESPGNGSKMSVVQTPHNVAFEQRGFIQPPKFFGCPIDDSGFSNFTNAVNIAAGVASAAIQARTVNQQQAGERNDINFYFTDDERQKIINKAGEIGELNLAPTDILEQFLFILCFIDNINDLRFVSEQIYLPEINDSSYIRNVDKILSVRNLHKIAFLACALSAIINRFTERFNNSTTVANSGNNNTANQLINSLTSLLAGGGGGANILEWLTQSSDTSSRIGRKLSEQLLGQKLPMTKIAKNPQLQKPSYTGKAFFCETAGHMTALDQVFNKTIAVFSQESAGAGAPSFNMMNLGALRNGGNGVSMAQAATFALTGSLSVPTSGFEGAAITQTVQNLGSMLGVASSALNTTRVELNRADNAIPFMGAINGLLSNGALQLASKSMTDIFQDLFNKNKDIDTSKQYTLPTDLTSMVNSIPNISSITPSIGLNVMQQGWQMASQVSNNILGSSAVGALGGALGALRDTVSL